MFVLYEKEKQKLPIKIWLENKEQLEIGAYDQAINLSNLPFAYKWVCLMPDVHEGYGMPIGGVIATENVIIPNAVGVDIGCGIIYAHTNIPVSLLRNTKTSSGTLVQNITGQIMRDVPTGFEHHKEPQQCNTSVGLLYTFQTHETIFEKDIANLQYQVGTLGGGNHFIELQEDKEGMLSIMIHSGSRNFGFKIANHFNKIAKELNKKWYSQVLPEWDLAFLPVESKEGEEYIFWMNTALDFAKENRQLMMERVKNIVFNMIKKYTDFKGINILLEVNAHHNYADIENHYNKNVWIHRKGAIRVREGELGIIPGAMGSYSYIVEGLGNHESFFSCSHGAGRIMSRKKASEEISIDKMMNDLKEKDIVLGVARKDNITDESRFAYKDIDQVINNELDLVKPIKRLRTVAVIKGSENNKKGREN